MSGEEDQLDFDKSMKTINKFIGNLYEFFETGEMKKEHSPFVECYT